MSKKDGNFTMTAITADRAAITISEALKQQFDDARHASKKIAAAVQVTPRTVKGWLSGESAPRAAELIALMREFDEVYEAVMQMTGRPAGNKHLTAAQKAALRSLLEE